MRILSPIPMPYRADWRLWAPELGGGSTLDQGVYTLSFAHMILGAPQSVHAAGTITHDVDATVSTTLLHPDGRHATSTSRT